MYLGQGGRLVSSYTAAAEQPHLTGTAASFLVHHAVGSPTFAMPPAVLVPSSGRISQQERLRVGSVGHGQRQVPRPWSSPGYYSSHAKLRVKGTETVPPSEVTFVHSLPYCPPRLLMDPSTGTVAEHEADIEQASYINRRRPRAVQQQAHRVVEEYRCVFVRGSTFVWGSVIHHQIVYVTHALQQNAAHYPVYVCESNKS